MLEKIEAKKKKMGIKETTGKGKKELFNVRCPTIVKKCLELGELTDHHFCLSFFSKNDPTDPENGSFSYFSVPKAMCLYSIKRTKKKVTIIDNPEHTFIVGFTEKIQTETIPDFPVDYDHHVENYNIQ